MRYKINDDSNTYLIIKGTLYNHKYYQDRNGIVKELKVTFYATANDGGTEYVTFEYNTSLHPDFKGQLIIPYNHMNETLNDKYLVKV